MVRRISCIDPNSAAHTLDQKSGDHQSQAAGAVFAGHWLLKEAWLQVRRHTGAIVGDGQDQAFVERLRTDQDARRHGSGFRAVL